MEVLCTIIIFVCCIKLNTIGIKCVNANLAAAITTIVIVLLLWTVVFMTGSQNVNNLM